MSLSLKVAPMRVLGELSRSNACEPCFLIELLLAFLVDRELIWDDVED